MVTKIEKMKLKKLLCETISLLCRSELSVVPAVHIEALIGITLNENDVLLISFKESISPITPDENSSIVDIDISTHEESTIRNTSRGNCTRASELLNSGTDAISKHLSNNDDSFVELPSSHAEDCATKLECKFVDNISMSEIRSDVDEATYHEGSYEPNISEMSFPRECTMKRNFNEINNASSLKRKQTLEANVNNSSTADVFVARRDNGQKTIRDKTFKSRYCTRNKRKISTPSANADSFPSKNVRADNVIEQPDYVLRNHSNFTSSRSNYLRADSSFNEDYTLTNDESLAYNETDDTESIVIKGEIKDPECIAFENSTITQNNDHINEVVSQRIKRRRNWRQENLSDGYSNSKFRRSEFVQSASAEQMPIEAAYEQVDATSYDYTNCLSQSIYDQSSSAELDFNMYRCQICSAQLRGRRTLYEHVRGTHLCVHMYGCPFCGVTFKWRSGLKRHRVKCHLAPTNDHALS